MKRRFLLTGAVLLGCLVLSATPSPSGPFYEFASPARPIIGKVTDPAGKPLAGVTVQVKGSDRMAVTAEDGSFTIDVPDGATTLIFSFSGMNRIEQEIGNRSTIDVQLQSNVVSMDEVVVVGYGTASRRTLTGAVGTVNGATLTQRPAPNAANLLQGRVTGLQVTQPSGEPGRDNPNLLIRGRGTFGGTTGPLVLIDGVTGSLNNLSPDDVENITVLKDAASAAIYGSRSANGVILVTTKRGRSGATVVSYRMNYGIHTPTALPELVTNSAEYMEMYNAAATRSGTAFKYPAAEIAKYKNATDLNAFPNFDYIDYYFRNGKAVNHNLSVSGGNEKNQFNLSLTYLNQDAMLPGYDFKRYNGLLNYTSKLSNRITVGTTMNLTYKDRQEPPFTSENMALLVYAAGPLYAPFLPDGSGRIASRAYALEGRNRNPQEAYAMGWQNTKEYNLNGQAYIDIKILKGLTWTSKVALNYVDEFYKMYQHPYNAYLLQQRDTLTNDYQTGSVAYFGPDYLGVTDQYVKAITPTIYSVVNYDTRFGSNHELRAMAGFEQVSYKVQSLRARRFNGVSTALTDLTGYSNTGEAINATYPRLPGLVRPVEWALQSFFGSASYTYASKYVIDGKLRYDGTSRVSPEYRWGLFPSVSAAWIISKEKFFYDFVKPVRDMKIRASLGTLGNQDANDIYAYQDVLTVGGVSYPFGNTTPQQGAVLNTYRDQSIQWESTRIFNLGTDIEFNKGLLGISFDWFRKVTSDILANQPVPASLGLGSPVYNTGKMAVKGIELEVRHNNTVGAVHYGVFGQISTAKNKVLEIKVPSIGTSINQVGLPYGSHFLYVWDGIFQVEDTAAGKTPKHILNPNPKPGDLKMKDVDGDGDVDADDRVVVKGAYPDYIYSFGFNVDFKGFSLSAFFQGVEGLKNRVNNWGVDPFMQGTAPSLKWRDAWTPQNRSNTLPGIYVSGYTGVSAYSGSTYYLMDASYLRMKNLMLSYNFSKSLISKLRARDLTMYVSAENVFTITDYEGSDPERSSTTGNFVQYPQARIFNLGFNIKF